MASNDPNIFLSSFMQGFSFVDDINSRKRQEAKLDQRLDEESKQRDFLRQRLSQQDAERGADRATSITDRQRREEANRILADPNASDEALTPFSDIPEVAQFLRNRRLDTQDRGDLERLTRGEGGLAGAVGGQAAPQAEAPQPGGLTGAVQPADIPADEFQVPEKLTNRELNELADSDPVAAMAMRDELSAEKDELAQLNRQSQQAGLRPGERGPTQGEKDRASRRVQQNQLTKEWDAFLDINDQGGDGLRQLDPNLLTAKYFDDRSNINDPDMRAKLDRRMAPNISATINTQQQVLSQADPQAPESRNARRKLSEAYGLANEIGVQYQPLQQSGVDGRGLPANGSNVALTDATVAQVDSGPGTSLPPDPSATRADLTMISRGTNGRVSERFAQAAYRQFKNGRITHPQYESLIRTGHMPSAAAISQTDPTKDTWMNVTKPDGSVTRQLIIPARKLEDPDKINSRNRNLIDDEGLAHLNRISSAYNTPDDPVRGTRLVGTFIKSLALNEQRARQGGYDLSSVNDVGLLYERFVDLHVVRDAYNDEWMLNGRANPDFTEDYGTLDDALFDRSVDAALATGEFEVPGSTTLGFGGESPGLTPLKSRDPRVYDAVRQQFPEFANSSNEEIEAQLAAQER